MALPDETLVAHLLHGGKAVNKQVFGSTEFGVKSRRMEQWEGFGFKVHVSARSTTRKEIFVDEAIQSGILREILRSEDTGTDNTLVLVTGDGNDNEGRTTFPEVGVAGRS